MASPELEIRYKQVIATLSNRLNEFSFKKSGTSFRRVHEQNIAIINVQRSNESTIQAIKFTINVGIVSARLLSKWDDQEVPSKQSVWQAHLRERIGTLAYGKDRWWTITYDEPPAAIEDEIVDIIERFAVPYLDQHNSDSALIALWKNGQSPGLTEGQRVRNLALIEEQS